jgi:hypothetical protein
MPSEVLPPPRPILHRLVGLDADVRVAAGVASLLQLLLALAAS